MSRFEVYALFFMVGVLLAMTWQLLHHDPERCRTCVGRRAEDRVRRADDGSW